jgi:CDGSH iron-sulfur domain-containing protein 3
MKKTPCLISLEQGIKYSWCTCGKSSKDPICDGTHKQFEGLKSLPFEVPETKQYQLCMCKKTQHPPFCDGSHNNE